MNSRRAASIWRSVHSLAMSRWRQLSCRPNSAAQRSRPPKRTTARRSTSLPSFGSGLPAANGRRRAGTRRAPRALSLGPVAQRTGDARDSSLPSRAPIAPARRSASPGDRAARDPPPGSPGTGGQSALALEKCSQVGAHAGLAPPARALGGQRWGGRAHGRIEGLELGRAPGIQLGQLVGRVAPQAGVQAPLRSATDFSADEHAVEDLPEEGPTLLNRQRRASARRSSAGSGSRSTSARRRALARASSARSVGAARTRRPCSKRSAPSVEMMLGLSR